MYNYPDYYKDIISGFEPLLNGTTGFTIKTDYIDKFYYKKMSLDRKRSSLNLSFKYYSTSNNRFYSLITLRLSECDHPLLKSFIKSIISSYKKSSICTDSYSELKSLHNTLRDKDPKFTSYSNPSLKEILKILNIRLIESSLLSEYA